MPEFAIKRIEVSNFKSFDNLQIDLDKFNVVIGANASGKSNFVQIFRFLRDIANHGLKNAISMHGGAEYLRNIKIKQNKNLSLKIYTDLKFGLISKAGRSRIGWKIKEVVYGFEIKFEKKDFEVVKDELIIDLEFVKLIKRRKKFTEKDKLGVGKIIISRNGENVKVTSEIPKDIPIEVDEFFPPFLEELKLNPDELLIQKIPSILIFPLVDSLKRISVYYIDPKLCKESVPFTGKAELEENGRNLTIVLKNILENDKTKKKLINLISDLLTFVRDFKIEKFADKYLLLKIKENYFEDEYLPASLISDGTINIIATIIALYFEEKPLIVIEEPERNIHPHLISKVVDMLKEASQRKQIIITTHNPEVVKYAGINNILLIKRDYDGFSRIYKPANKVEVRTFLEHEIGIEELYVQELL